jgi:hypothetical protein
MNDSAITSSRFSSKLRERKTTDSVVLRPSSPGRIDRAVKRRPNGGNGMKTTILAAMFALGVSFVTMPAASAAEATGAYSKAQNGYTLTFDARRHCRMEKVCKHHWHPHCRLIRVCHGD